MGFPRDEAGRVSQSKYWALFGAYMLIVPILLIGGVVELSQAGIGLGLLMIAAIVPLGMYWRVIMMRRCRDIGWPAFLPWLSWGLQMLASFSATGSLHSLRDGATPPLALLTLPVFMALADFVFSIVIGCIGTKDGFDYARVFGDDERDFYQRPDAPQPSQPAQPVPSQRPALPGEYDDRYDEAIARALEAHRRGESVTSPAPPVRPVPAGPARPAGGFGRRML